MAFRLVHVIDKNLNYKPKFCVGSSFVVVELSKDVLTLFRTIIHGQPADYATDGPIHILVAKDDPLTLSFQSKSGDLSMVIENDDWQFVLFQILHANYHLHNLANDIASVGGLSISEYVKRKICGRLIDTETVEIEVY